MSSSSTARRFVGKKKSGGQSQSATSSVDVLQSSRGATQIPGDIVDNAALNAVIAQLPSNYAFEVSKCIWRIRESGAKCVALQMPEGLLAYACVLADIVGTFANVDTVIMGDVTYGACCVDDATAAALGCDYLIHYGHSCLVPIHVTTRGGITVQYVFVDIKFDLDHFRDSMRLNFAPDRRLALVSTVQFAASLHAAHDALADSFAHLHVPQARPLSAGELLGCTSPKLDAAALDALVYIGDGRFHLESAMISNPSLPAYRYDPYDKKFTRETYDHALMLRTRKDAVDRAKSARSFGIIHGTLGRQGNPAIVRRLEGMLRAKGIPFIVVLLSEIFPAKLALFADVDAWVQVACPRLSIDWGLHFGKPLLNPYEAEVVLNHAQPWCECYPMDFYRKDGGAWTNYHDETKSRER